MSEQKNDPMTGVLFVNNRKEKDTHPDLNGFFTDEDGVEWYLNGWRNESKSGVKYIKLKCKAKDQPRKEAPPKDENGFSKDFTKDIPDDDIPF